ncbi:TonB-dependent receptor [Salinisphaera sp. SPP-AMP-43]|uniref:TonB-dependent receptor n=1 Tax=Salinisphaera sp. SPP-AMP-43 TaxID=3121288 RepID=UPI003C6E6A2B
MAPIASGWAQSPSDDGAGYVAPAASSADSGSSDDAADGDATAPAPAAPAAAAPAAASDDTAAAAPAGAASSAATASASTGSATELGNLTVTGTALSSADAATALPVTDYSGEDLREQGVTSTEQFLQRVAGNNSSYGAGLSTGTANTGGASFANLRGLGPNKTLILLNGRRLAPNALNGNGSAVDLNTIPFAAIDHVEILRDGASALYGTDAIGGVINFITKKNLDGGNLNLNYSVPTRDGGGNASTVSATFGKGDFAKDGWNVMGTLTYQRQDAVNVNDRGFITPEEITSSNTFPSNYYQGGLDTQNPAASGCGSAFGLLPNASAPDSCRENFAVLGGSQVVQKKNQPSFFGQASYKINDKNKVSLSYLWSRSETYVTSAAAPTSGNISVNPGTPFYPGNGITPAPSAAGFDASQPVTLNYRTVPLGNRVARDVNENHRVVLDFTGRFMDGFHYDTALSYAQSSTEINLQHGFVNQAATIGTDANGNPIYDPNSLQTQINAGNYNPFTTNVSDAQRQTLLNAETTGRLNSAKTRSYIWDGKIDHEIGDWFGSGQSQLALGAQYRHETLTDTVDGYLAARSPSEGFAASHVDEDRDVEGVFGELNVPLLTNLTLDAQARYDNYSDVGDTVNPKVSLRYQPIEQLTLRASYSEGFHAPTLYDLYQPQVSTFTGAALNDPVQCPGGNPVPGANAANACGNQFHQITGGNADLQPEKSKSWSAGFVLQPAKYVSLTADFFAVELSQQIGSLDPTYIFNNYDQYASRFNRDSNGEIVNFSNTNYNNGKTELNGEDVQLNVTVPSDYGTFTLTMNGTYMNKYDTQVAENGPYTQNVSNYALQQNIFRWSHNVTLGWSKGPMALGVVNHYKSGYQDYEGAGHPHVHDYVTWDTYGSYKFDNGLQLTLGSDNVFDADPPYSAQPDAGNAGYDARYASGLGRTVYGRLSYNF